MKRLLGAALVAALGTGFAARPQDPFVIRGVMREKPRMILLALSSNFSVAYDGQTSGLYEAWNGPVQNGNATYDHGLGDRGATLYPIGKIVYAQKPGGAISSTPLTLQNDGRPTSFSPANEKLVQVWSASSGTVKADYRGYTLDNSKQVATLRYDLSVGGATVHVKETPDVSSGGGLQRDFTFTGIPSGNSIMLQLTGSGVTGVTESWTVASGGGKVQDVGGKSVLVMTQDGQTQVVGTWK
jgi:hypothetical protein